MDDHGRTFDLTGHRPEKDRGARSGQRLLLGIGVAFTLAGIGIDLYLRSQGFVTLAETILVVAVFATVGWWMPVAGLLSRPYRRFDSLRLDSSGFALSDSRGKAVVVAWTEPGLSIAFRQDVSMGGASPGPGGQGERMILFPRRVQTWVGPDAREALLDAARAHGFAYGEQTYSRISDGRPSALVGCIDRAVALGPPGSTTAGSAVPSTGPPAGTGRSSESPAAVETYDVSSPPILSRSQIAPPGPNRIVRVDVSAEGAVITKRNGGVVRFDWRDPRLRLSLLARLESAVTPFDATTISWVLTPRGRGDLGRITGPCAAALVRAAERHGLWCLGSRFPGLARPPEHWWLATLEIRPPIAR